MIRANFKLNIFELTLCGLFVSLWIFTYNFINFNFGFMSLSINYALAIVIGLIFRPWVGLITILIADNLAVLLSNPSFWMIEYALIYPLIVLSVNCLNPIFKLKNDKIWVSLVITLTTLIIIISSLISFMFRNFVSESKNSDQNLYFNHWSILVLVWIMLFGIIVYVIYNLYRYFKTKSQKIKNNLTIFMIITFTIICFVWIWGPIAQIQFLAKHFNGKRLELFQNYGLFLIPRILKTPIILPIYFFLTSLMFNSYKMLNVKYQTNW